MEEVSFKGSALGLMLAGLSVVGSGMQQILVRSMQQVGYCPQTDMRSRHETWHCWHATGVPPSRGLPFPFLGSKPP